MEGTGGLRKLRQSILAGLGLAARKCDINERAMLKVAAMLDCVPSAVVTMQPYTLSSGRGQWGIP